MSPRRRVGNAPAIIMAGARTLVLVPAMILRLTRRLERHVSKPSGSHASGFLASACRHCPAHRDPSRQLAIIDPRIRILRVSILSQTRASNCHPSHACAAVIPPRRRGHGVASQQAIWAPCIRMTRVSLPSQIRASGSRASTYRHGPVRQDPSRQPAVIIQRIIF